MSVLIEAQHLSKTFGDVIVVDNINLQISSGEIYGLVGPDGAGKTTTMRLLCGAYLPDEQSNEFPAHILLGGYDVVRQTELARAQIGYLPQRFSLYEEMTVIENLRFFAEVRGLPPREWKPRCQEILEFVGLEDFLDRRAGHLSGGMKQKLGLAAALVHNPRVLLLDEPTTGVDPVTRQDFWQLIIRLVAQNGSSDQETAVLVSTPYMDEATRCTRVGFMIEGEMVDEGTPPELCRYLEGQILELAGTPLPRLRRMAMDEPYVENVQMFGDRLHIRVMPGKTDQVIDGLNTHALAEGWQVQRLRTVTPQLEDVFMGFVERSG